MLKKTTSFLSWLMPFVILIVVALGCNQNDSVTSTQSNSTAPAPSAPPAVKDISGTYDITGTNENGAGQYKGTLIVTNRGEVQQFSWDTAGKKYDGVGVRTGDTVGVAFSEGVDGKGCGVVLYNIGSDGKLDGKAGYWGNDNSETETATRTKGTDLEGEYDIKGTNTGGQSYEGKLAINKSGAGYTFSWTAGTSFEGFGIRQGNTVAAGFGGNKCGFVSYQLKPDGTLDGKWGGYGSKSVGTEIAKKN